MQQRLRGNRPWYSEAVVAELGDAGEALRFRHPLFDNSLVHQPNSVGDSDAEPKGFATGSAVVENRSGRELFSKGEDAELARINSAGKADESGKIEGGTDGLLDSEPFCNEALVKGVAVGVGEFVDNSRRSEQPMTPGKVCQDVSEVATMAEIQNGCGIEDQGVHSEDPQLFGNGEVILVAAIIGDHAALGTNHLGQVFVDDVAWGEEPLGKFAGGDFLLLVQGQG